MKDSESSPDLEMLVRKAVDGNRTALEELVGAIQDQIYDLASYMLWHPEDARDATQEILIKVITNLDSFRFESAVTTWVYRIATNHLLTTRKRRAERNAMTFEDFEKDLEEGLGPSDQHSRPDQKVLREEVKIGCTRGMLLCLDRKYRVAYVLGEVFEVSSEDAGKLLDISAGAYRKRLSRARKRIRRFMRTNCGIVNSEAPCRCNKQISPAIDKGRVDPNNLLFVDPGKQHDDNTIKDRVNEMEELHEVASVYRHQPKRGAPDDILEEITQILNSDDYQILSQNSF